MKIKVYTSITIFLLLSVYINCFSQWTLTPNFGAYYVVDLAVKDNFIFASADTIGVFRSSDNGLSWTAVNSGFTHRSIPSIAKNSSDLFGSAYSGVYRSSNNGSNWSFLNNGLIGGPIVKVITDGNNIYAAYGLAGVYRSTNNGNSWSRFALGEGDLMYTLHSQDNVIYISVANTIYRTTDNGLTFQNAVNGITNLNVRSLSSYQSDIYAGTFGGVFHSTNYGNLWTGASIGLTDTTINEIINKEEVVIAGTRSGGIFVSVNKGQSWSAVNTGLTEYNISALAANDTYLFAGTTTGRVWRRLWSEIITDINEENNFVTDFNVSDNYPNPFNPQTTVSYNLLKASDVVIEIYNVNGKKIETLISSRHSPGSYTIKWHSGYNPSGVYFMQLSAGSISVVRKLFLVK